MSKTKQKYDLTKWVQRDDCNYRYDYNAIFAETAQMSPEEATATYRDLCKRDLFFLLVFGLQRFDANKPFVVQLIRDIEDGPDTETLDLIPREHYKSTIRTCAQLIQEILLNPNIRIVIFSHTRPIAKGFLREIKHIAESNLPIVHWFRDIFWDNPERDSPKWSEDEGLLFKRTRTAKEMTVEAFGLVDGQPTSRHYDLRIYDDVVTKESVSTPDQIRNTQRAYETSQSLGTEGGRFRVLGTHWHHADLYTHLRKIFPPENVRVIDGWDAEKGRPVLFSLEHWESLKRQQSPYVFACNYRMNPVSDETKEFKIERIRRFGKPPRLYKYLLCDPANSKKRWSDYSVFAVVGVDSEGRLYLIDAVRDKIDLSERWEVLKELCRKHRPRVIGYERYGKDSDIQHYEVMQRVEGIYLPRIVELGGKADKVDRIRSLTPYVNEGRFFVPERGIIYKGKNLVDEFLEELDNFPYAQYDDFVDAVSRIEDSKLDKRLPPNERVESNVINLWDKKIAATYDMV